MSRGAALPNSGSFESLTLPTDTAYVRHAIACEASGCSKGCGSSD